MQFNPLDGFLNIVFDLTADRMTVPLIQVGEIIELQDKNVDSDEISSLVILLVWNQTPTCILQTCNIIDRTKKCFFLHFRGV